MIGKDFSNVLPVRFNTGRRSEWRLHIEESLVWNRPADRIQNLKR
jgi:hypothetical protein